MDHQEDQRIQDGERSPKPVASWMYTSLTGGVSRPADLTRNYPGGLLYVNYSNLGGGHSQEYHGSRSDETLRLL